MALLLKHQTAQEFIARFREAYRNAERERVVQLARFLIAKVQAGDLTETQIRNAFGLNVSQWNTFKTKMQNYIAADNTVRSVVGE